MEKVKHILQQKYLRIEEFVLLSFSDNIFTWGTAITG